MTSKNIEQFDVMAGQILGYLYSQFPVPVELGASRFTDFTNRFSGPEYDKFINEVNFFNATAGWLVESGYIRCKGVGDNKLAAAVLTNQALLALKSIPGSLTKGPSIGERLSMLGKNGATELFKGLVSEALGLGAKLIAPIIGVTA